MPRDPSNATRRAFLRMLGAGLAVPFIPIPMSAESERLFRIRTITAGITLDSPEDTDTLRDAIAFLEKARGRFVEGGYEVQTVRVATQPLPEYLPEWLRPGAIDRLIPLDRIAAEHGVMLNIGPVIIDDRYVPELPSWSSTLIARTTNTSHTVVVASPEHGVHRKSARSAGETISRIARDSDGGVGNFRFAATAFSPPETPFFPAAYHRGATSFGIGLESPRVLTRVVKAYGPEDRIAERMAAALDADIAPIEAVAMDLADEHGRGYAGLDTSPAPGLDASIGETIEAISGEPFGSPSTLAACALVTEAIQAVIAKSCGYSGLMLPVLEDKVLAQRAVEGRFGVEDILLYSCVCGTGLDVVPLPGDSTENQLAGLVLDVAALSAKYRKPLSARLFPIPGKRPGEPISFDNPFLTDCVVMPLA